MEFLKSKLNEFGLKVNQLGFELNDGETAIDEYSRELVRQVQLATEIKIQKLEQEIESIKNHSGIMIKYIDEHKRKLTTQYNGRKTNIDRLAIKSTIGSKLIELETFIHDSEEKLKRPEHLNANIISSLTYDVQLKQALFDIEKNKAHNLLLQNDRLNFVQKKDSKIGGVLTRKKESNAFHFDQVEKLNNIYFRKEFILYYSTLYY